MCVWVMSYSLWPHGLFSPPGSCPWNFPGRILEWGAISSSRASSWPRDRTRISYFLLHWQVPPGEPSCWCEVKLKSLSCIQLFATSRTVAYQALCPWDFPGKSTGMGCHFLLQGIFPTQGLNPGLPHCRQTLYHLSHQESLRCTCTQFWGDDDREFTVAPAPIHTSAAEEKASLAAQQ